ncbi:sigma factor [Ornithinibacillus scapharcae]|uniref:RNA polymerase sigma factor n=1 Tax=Ornithinibacillus scapharcae TaxID=1147159 RepID=UPI000225B084
MNNDRSSPFLNLEKIYQENFHYLSSYLINLTSNKQLTEDIIQETFLKLLKSPEKIKQVSYIRSWLVVNVRNTLIDHYRKKVLASYGMMKNCKDF